MNRRVPPVWPSDPAPVGDTQTRSFAEAAPFAQNQGQVVVDVPLGDISAGYLLRDRIAFDPEELDALKASIRAHGQRTPVEITPITGAMAEPSPYRYGLIAGWRRLRALGQLLEETGEVRFSTVRALIRPRGEIDQSYVAMVEENEVRTGLSHYERARLVVETTARGVFADQSAALRTLFATASPSKRSKIGSFVILHEELGDVLRYPSAIAERLGLRLATALREQGAAGLRAALMATEPKDAASELKLLTKFAQGKAEEPLRRASDPERLAAGVTMRVERKRGAMKVTLTCDEVDEDLLARLRRALGDGASE